MAQGAPGIACFVNGKITDLDGKPLGGAMLDCGRPTAKACTRRSSARPKYMRGIYYANPDGTYIVRTVAPIGYTIPMDGPVGELMSKTKISHMRPAHIHFHIASPGFKA